MKVDLKTIEETELVKLPIEDKKKIIEDAVDLVISQCVLIGQTLDIKPSKVLNDTMVNITKQIALQEENENYELCYFLNELMWGLRSRLDKLKKPNDDGLSL